jgi:hypothetical protein
MMLALKIFIGWIISFIVIVAFIKGSSQYHND